LDVVLRNAVLDLTNAGGIGVAPTLAATLLRETGDVAQPLAPGVIRIERKALCKAALKGGLQGIVIRDALALDITDAGQVG